jgi:photosystem II stability/assembly factor-like uncharacterized protein
MLKSPELETRGGKRWRVFALMAAIMFLLLGNWQTLQAGEEPWEKTKGPPGLQVTVIYKSSGIVFAGTVTQGVYKSADDGVTWVAANTGIELTQVHDLIASGGNLLAATSSKSFLCPAANNVFKSTDNGNTWTPTSGLSAQIVNSFALKGSFVYAGFANINGSGIFRSADNGNTWQSVASPIVKGDKIFVSDNAIIVASDNFIWRSLSDGASWTLVEQFALTGINSFARAGTKLFATGTTVIWTSLDNGGSWTLTPFPDGASSLSSDGSTIYLGSGSKVFKSTDMGGTWDDVSTGLGHGSILALLFDGTNLFAGTPADAAGIYRSTNGGTSWEPAADGLPIGSNIRSMISFGGYVFAGTEADGIYRSSDHGDTWVKTDASNNLLNHGLVLTFCAKGDMLFAGAANGIYRSTDGGATFSRVINGFPTNTGVAAFSLTVSSGNIVAGVDVSVSPTSTIDAIFYSSDDGDTWHRANLPSEVTFVPAVASDGSSLAYAGVITQHSSTTGLYKSSDAGITWDARTSSLTADLNRMAVNGNNVLGSTLFGALYSLDFGEGWAGSSIPASCPGGCGIFTYTLRGSTIFAGLDAGMFRSTNQGASFSSFNEGFAACPKPDVEASCSDSNYLYAGTTGEGVWRKLLDPVFATPTPTPEPSATAPPTATPTPTATGTPAATPTPSPSATPTPVATPTPSPTPAAQTLNLSTRMRVQTGDGVGVGGFIITGTTPKHVLLRAIGPSLTASGVPDALADPVLELHGPGAFVTIIDDNWKDDPAQETAILATGIPPTNDFESAIDATLNPGTYTAIVRGKNNTSGIGLVEVYDLDEAGDSKLANLSTRAFVSTGDSVVIAGFILGGNNGNDTIITRGIGPSLAASNVSNVLADPTLELRNSDGALVAANNDWQDDAEQAAALMAVGLAPTDPLESGIAATLPPGLYTALLAGLNGGTGVGLVDVYDLGMP